QTRINKLLEGYRNRPAADMDTIADLQLLNGLLAKRGYLPEDIEKIFHKNWLRFLQTAWRAEI
ncbi:MAG TPA: membrane dipeptidase, partial [Agriterribacter sp.]|nr:membrane dipeptidase [Agriterribacter sp.]